MRPDTTAPKVEWAIWHAEQGRPVFPLAENSKVPMKGMRFKDLATTDESTIRAWWEQWPEANVGIYTGHNLLVVDVDNKNGKRGSDEVMRLDLEGFELTATTKQGTLTGWHLLYEVAAPVSGGTNKLAPGVDIKSAGSYIVGGGSTIDGKRYTIDDTPIAPAPAWLIERCGKVRDKAPAADAPAIQAPSAERNAIHYLQNEAPLAIEGQAGDATTFKVAAQVKDFGATEGQCFALMAQHWNERCSPPWSQLDLMDKVRNAYRYGTEAQGSAAPEADFVPVVPKPGEPLPVEYARTNGRIDPSMNNIVKALSRPIECGYHLALDTFRDDLMIRPKDAAEDQWVRFKDTDYARLRMHLEDLKFKNVSREMVKEAVRYVAERHTFDSAIFWLDSLKWDGAPRVGRFFAEYFGTPPGEYSTAVSNYWWSGLAGRVLRPPCQCDIAVIVTGAQGIGKTQGAKAMVPSPEHFVEIDLSRKDDDLARSMRGTLVGEIGELRGMNSREAEELKQWVSRQSERWVPKYLEFATTYPRRTMLIATTNSHEFLADDTGERRWLPLRSTGVDVDAIRRDREQLWAEGAELFRQHGVLWQDAARLAGDHHADYKLSDPWQGSIARWLDERVQEYDSKGHAVGKPWRRGDRPVQMDEMLERALRHDPTKQTQAAERRAGRVLRSMGYNNTIRRRIDGANVRLWVLE